MKRRFTNIVGSVILAASFILGTSSASSVRAQDWRYRQNQERRQDREYRQNRNRHEEMRQRRGYYGRNNDYNNRTYGYRSQRRLNGWYDRWGNFHPYRRY